MEKELEILSREPIPNMSVELMKRRLENVLELISEYDKYLKSLKDIDDEIINMEAEIAGKKKQIEICILNLKMLMMVKLKGWK